MPRKKKEDKEKVSTVKKTRRTRVSTEKTQKKRGRPKKTEKKQVESVNEENIIGWKVSLSPDYPRRYAYVIGVGTIRHGDTKLTRRLSTLIRNWATKGWLIVEPLTENEQV